MNALNGTGKGGDIAVAEGRWSGPRRIALCLLLFAAGVLNGVAGWAGWPHLRFGMARLNGFGGLIVLGIPWIVFLLTMTSRPFRKAWIRIALLTVLIPVMLATIPAALMGWNLWLSNEPIRSVEMGGYRITLYQLECGVLCDFAVGVDQERVLIPPLMLSKRLYIFDEAVDATIEILGKNKLRVKTLPYTEKNPNVRVQVFQLKPHFFF
jgi:hypothetical protein